MMITQLDHVAAPVGHSIWARGMTLAGKAPTPARLIRWTGILVATAGAVLLGEAIARSGATPNWPVPAGLPSGVNWVLLVGMLCVLGGGGLVQVAWRNGHG